MHFNLVYHRTDRYRFQFTVSCHEIACRLMDKHQIDVVGSKQFQTLFYGSFCQILAYPDFGGDENVLSCHTGSFDSASDRALIHVSLCRVDHAVSAG